MKSKTILIAFLLGFVLFAAGCGKKERPSTTTESAVASSAPGASTSTAPATAEDKITARSHLDRVMAEAAKWRADAEPVGVFTSYADGPAAAFWLYDFQSPSTKLCTRLRVFAAGRLDTAEPEHECRIQKPVTKDFVDSPAAMSAAVNAGLKKGESVEFHLRFLKDKALATPRICWVVSSDFDSEEGVTRAWCVDPGTGAFVTRLSGYGGPVFE